MADTTTTRGGRGPATVFAWAFGVVFVLVAIWGFMETGFSDWTAPETDDHVLWFQVNPLHNLVHLLVGAGLLAGAARGEWAARLLTLLVSIAYLVVGLAGFWLIGKEANMLALNEPDNWLHLVTAALGFAAVIASDRRRPSRRSV